MNTEPKVREKQERGAAILAALFFMLIVAALGGLHLRLATAGLRSMPQSEAIVDTFATAEGAVHDVIRAMLANPGVWRARAPLGEEPEDYAEYSPLSFSGSNGIPTCAGVSCHRSLYPTGGGLLKNVGPIPGDGEVVDTSYPVSEQVDPDAPPSPDIELAGTPAWLQVERLDEVPLSPASMGATLINNPGASGGSKAVRFRVTGTSQRSVRTKLGRATVVVVLEMPAT